MRDNRKAEEFGVDQEGSTTRSRATAVDYAARPCNRSCPRCGGIAHPDELFAHKEPPAGDGAADAFAGLDWGIAGYVRTLWENGVETYQSCQGGDGHSFPEPTIQFTGSSAAGYRAFQIAKDHALPVQSIRRAWQIIDGDMVGPEWEMTFRHQCQQVP
jgi:hypothetical protein